MCCIGIWRVLRQKSVIASAWLFFNWSCGTEPAVSALLGQADRYNGIHVDIGAADVAIDKHFVTQLKGKNSALCVCVFFMFAQWLNH